MAPAEVSVKSVRNKMFLNEILFTTGRACIVDIKKLLLIFLRFMGPGTESAHEVPFLCSPAAHRQPCCLVEGRHWGDPFRSPGPANICCGRAVCDPSASKET